MFGAGVKPQVLYGAQQYGLSWTNRKELDSLARMCLGANGRQACGTFLLQVKLGNIPSVLQIRKQIAWWIDFWSEASEEVKKDVNDNWGTGLLRKVRKDRKLLEEALGRPLPVCLTLVGNL